MRENLSRDLKAFRVRKDQFTALSHDAWIAANSEIEPQRLHALGVISFRWNTSEQLLFHLFTELLNASQTEAEILAHELGSVPLMRRIRVLASIRFDKDRKLIALIENALAVYDHSRQNRNQFTHFNIQLALGEERKSGFKFVRKIRKPGVSPRLVPFSDKLQDLRRVAKEIRRLNVQLKTLNDAVFLKKRPEALANRQARLAQVKALTPLKLPELIWKPSAR